MRIKTRVPLLIFDISTINAFGPGRGLPKHIENKERQNGFEMPYEKEVSV